MLKQNEMASENNMTSQGNENPQENAALQQNTPAPNPAINPTDFASTSTGGFTNTRGKN